MNASNKIKLNSNRTDDIGNSYGDVVDAIFVCVNEYLLSLMSEMLRSADSILIMQANKSISDREKAKYTNCTQVFKTESTDISHHFFIQLNKSLVNNSVKEVDESFVDQDEMDEMVAITTMHSKAMATYGGEVNNLETRLEYLEIVYQDMFDKEALDPKHICEVFQKTIENIDLAIEAKLIFYKLFDQEVCLKMGDMYHAINNILIDNNILSEIILNTTNTCEIEHLEDNVSSRVASYYSPGDNVQTDFVPRTQEDISRIVNEFMTGDMTITGDEIDLPESFLRKPTQQDIEGRDCYDRKEVVKALSILQRKLLSIKTDTKAFTTKQIKNELIDNIRDEGDASTGKHVNLLDERNIDFVGLMFEKITDDKTISTIVTSMILRLQIPIMKVAMADAGLFVDENHPARTIVNLLTKVGKGIDSKEERLFYSLEAIVDSILNDYDTDTKVFENAVLILQNILSAEEKLASKTERLQQKKILQNHARNIVTTQFKLLFKNKKLPNKLRPLVLKNWSSLMLNRYLHYGRDSSQWSQSVDSLKLLLKCLQPLKFVSQYSLVKDNHASLTKSINDALCSTKQDKKDISFQINILKSFFLQCIDNFDSTKVTSDVNALTEENIDHTQLDEINKNIETAEIKLSKLTEDTKPGAWYEIYMGEDKAIRRLKLSIILNDAAQLIFVDRKGRSVLEKDAEEFAIELNEKRSNLIADHSTFDHALGKVMNMLGA